MKISIIQFAPVLGDTLANTDKLSILLSKCKNTDLIIIPELANSGYNLQSKEEAINCSIEPEASDFIEFLKKSSIKLDAGIICGINEKLDDDLYNSAIFIDKGKIIGSYRKLHLFLNEYKLFKPGDSGLPIFEFRGIKIGILICFDWLFPEAWRHLALNGVDLICHPSNLVLPHAQNVIPVYALINRIYIATANRIGTENDLTFSGNSIVADPNGKVIGSASRKNEEVLTVEIDTTLSKNKMLTPLNDAFTDRRLDVYGDLSLVTES